MNYQLSYAGRRNNRNFQKPFEDMICVDSGHKLFLVLDGITRVHAEYDGTDRSAASEVNRIFSQKLFSLTGRLNEVRTPEDFADTLRGMLLEANAALIPFRQAQPLEHWQYYPGTEGILAGLWEERLFCAWVGDCIGIHMRGEDRRVIASQQTLRAKALGFSKDRLYAEVCNHPEHPCAYGIYNGDAQTAALLQESWTELLPGDVVLLSTDGMAEYLQQAPVSEVRALEPERLIEASTPYDCPPYATYADDKAIIRIVFF